MHKDRSNNKNQGFRCVFKEHWYVKRKNTKDHRQCTLPVQLGFKPSLEFLAGTSPLIQVHKPRLPSTGHFQHFHSQRHLKWFPDPGRVPPAPPGSGRGTAPGCLVRCVGLFSLPPVGSAASQVVLRDSSRGSGAVRRSQLLAGDTRTISKHQLLPDQITLQLGRGAGG